MVNQEAHAMGRYQMLLLPILLSLSACSRSGTQSFADPPSDRIVCFIPGVGGDGATYSGLKAALVNAGAADLRVFTWGASGPLFVLNFQDAGIHEKAESDLAAQIQKWLTARPNCAIDLVSHSAGGGVALGALRRLPPSMRVRNVILLHPSVSPAYDLAPALRHVARQLHNFHSERDVASLKWRTSTFGTYDNLKTPAAGHGGFQPLAPLPADLATKLVQHPYKSAWEPLGNDGSHAGPVAEKFIRQIVAPFLVTSQNHQATSTRAAIR